MGVKIVVTALSKDLEMLHDPYARLYLGGAYSNVEDKDVIWAQHNMILAGMSAQGHQVFSPIVHSHWADQMIKDKKMYDFWLNHCLDMLNFWATGMLIYKDKDKKYRESSGLMQELKRVGSLNMPVGYVRMVRTKSDGSVIYWLQPNGDRIIREK